MSNTIPIILLSEVFITIDLLDSALSKLNLANDIKITGSHNEAYRIIEEYNFSIVVTDSYILKSVPLEWIQTMIQLHPGLSFILVAHDEREEDILQWMDAGFSNIVHNALGLTISLKKEIQNQLQFKEQKELEKKLRQSNLEG